MPPKRSVPPPQSDESFSEESGEEQQKRQKKKAKPKPVRAAKSDKEVSRNPDEKQATGKVDQSDSEDDGSDLFVLKPPPPPEFLSRTESRKDRLMILNVEVDNFKSYEGKASIGPFHKSFTSIIGPNGSGKSNLIDSLLFVFGFRANKIRSAKVANLIHKSAGKDPSSCTVNIHFQRIIDMPGGNYEVVPDSTFEISRTVYQNGSSSYAIDGRSASKTEVETRLRLADIDIEHNRFLILQGEVEQIAMMKPVKTNKNETGMVEYLEDIIGSNRLEPFVRKFSRRVEKLNITVSQQRVKRDHARSSKVSLEGPVRTAIEFLNAENEEKTIQMKLDQRRRKRFLDKVAPQQAEIDAKKEELKVLTTKLDANKNDYKESEKKSMTLTKELEGIDSKVIELKEEVSNFTNEEMKRTAEIKKNETEIAKCEADKEKEEKKRETLAAAPEKAEKKIKKWKEEVEQLTEIEATANALADTNLEEFGTRSQKQKEEQQGIQETFAKCNAELNKARSSATVARDEFEDMTKMAKSGTVKLDQLVAKLSNSEETHKKQKEELDRLKPESETWKEKYKMLSAQVPDAKAEVRQINQELNQAQEIRDTLSRQNARSTSGNQVVKQLMKEKEAGRIPSFMGRLGDMGVIDKKYDRCISCNYGGLMDYLIVQTVADSAKVVHFLITNKLRRQTVLALDKCGIRPHQYAPIPPGKYPGPRVFDLIECEPEMKQAFWFVLSGTIVADSVQQAIQWNRGGFRGTIVTLTGSLIAPNGNVTGGGGDRYGSILTDKNQVPKAVTAEDREKEQAATRKVEQLMTKANELRNKEQKLDREYIEARRQTEDSARRVEILEDNVKAEASAIETLKKTVEAQQKEAAKVTVDDKQLEAKKKIVEELEKKRDELSEETGKVQKRLEEIQSKLDSLFRELVQCHRDEAKDALSKRQKLEKEMAKENANIVNSGRNVAKCEENIARFEKDIEKKKKKIEALQEKAVDEEAVKAKNNELKTVQDKREEISKEIDEISKKHSELSEAETQLEEGIKKCTDETNDLKAKLAADTHEIKNIEKKLSAILINRIPRFQFLQDSSRPEDVPMQFDELAVDENQTPEEVEKRKNQMASKMTDDVYAKEFEMRRKVLENTETFSNVDGNKLIPIVLLTDEQVAALTTRDNEELTFNLKKAQQQLDALKGKVDVSVIDTYVKKVNEYNEQVKKLAVLVEDHRRHNNELQRLKHQRLEEFHSAFEFIGKHLVAVYKMLTDGGDAKLEYIDKDDPFNNGISFMVRPAKKAWKQIQFLSGGEKTLSSLALIFALHMFRPTPFYVMDEIDAALDYRNVSIIAQYVRQKTENAQFIIISLRNNMFELANRLVGIYKVEGRTRNVAIDPQRVCEMAKAITDSLGQITCTLPDEVSKRFNDTMSRQNKELTAKEKQYPNFPSSSEITKAEKIVSVEGRVRKELNHTDSSSRPQSKATNGTSDMPASSRSESRVNHSSAAHPPERSASCVSRTPRKERNIESDDTTPPAKRSTSTTATTTRSPRKRAAAGYAENNDTQSIEGDEEE